MRAWYNVNPGKAVEVIVWLAHRANAMDFYRILKVLFFAEKKHLNEYGRPILGDTYDALPHGPVARTVYGLLRQDDVLETQFLADCKDELDAPFERFNRYWIRALREPDLSEFSMSELEALEWAYAKYSRMSFDELENLTHAEVGWRNARERDRVICYEDMLEGGHNRLFAAKTQIARGAPQMLL